VTHPGTGATQRKDGRMQQKTTQERPKTRRRHPTACKAKGAVVSPPTARSATEFLP
jgi:hypothetical protein